MDLRLDDAVVLVTGASRGLGAAVATALAAEGAHVVATARSTTALAELSSPHGKGGRIVALECDLQSEESVRSLVPEVITRYGRIDGLINNAGIAPAGKFIDDDIDKWNSALQVNVIAPMLLAQAVGKHMIDQGGGRIVNVASTTGVRGKPGLVCYSTTKGAMVRMTEALAAEWAKHNIQVNCIAPGAFLTDAQRAVTESESLYNRRINKIPARRMADPAELVPLACLLVSSISPFTTGGTYVIDGGESGKL